MDRFFPKEKIVITGNPVRSDLQSIDNKKQDAKRFFDWGHNQKTLLMVGGSLGARTLNEAAKESYALIESRPDVLFIWQTGKLYFEELKSLKIAQLPNVRIMPFVERMDLAYALADIIIARAGALTISELGMIGKPAVLVPSPNVAEDHQTKNAMALVDADAAILVKDKEAVEVLFTHVFELLNDEKKQLELSNNVSNTAMPNATELIVNEIDRLVIKNK
ncbi:UNVERIFIED_CONTAM: hypothetical protein GTU68_004705 [Idotea baltica]|nr:hypothetical protein [Idotea baltica]